MIADKLTNLNLYPEMHPYEERIFAFVEKATKESLPVGRYDIDGDELFALIQTYNTKPMEEGRFEGHKKYTDIQYLIEGEEYIYWNPVEALTVEDDQTPGADILFFQNDTPQGVTQLSAGVFGLYLPTDAHMPCISVEESTPVKKIVFKIKYHD